MGIINPKKELKFYVLCDNTDITCSETDYSLYHNNEADSLLSDSYISGDAHIPDRSHYGRITDLYNIWQSDTNKYIGISLCSDIPLFSYKDQTELTENTQLIYIKEQPSAFTPHDLYRAEYYDYDLRILRNVLSKKYPVMFRFEEDKYLDDNINVFPSAIMRKDFFKKFCAWLFPVLADCEPYISSKASNMQNKYFEHLAQYLFSLYILYNSDRVGSMAVESYHLRSIKAASANSHIIGSLEQTIQNLLSDGMIEDAMALTDANQSDPSYSFLKRIFEDYTRQRHHYKETDLDKEISLSKLKDSIKTPSIIGERKKKVLILLWDSINNDDLMNAFMELGFECEFSDIRGRTRRSNKYIEHYADLLDERSYDLIYSTNYFNYLSEAAYIHNTPYIAWAYDSPTELDKKMYRCHDTTNIFLMDSDEVASYRDENSEHNIHYLPLAVDIKKYDGIECTSEDLRKYSAQISFVGSLYDNKLNEYLNYLSDYKKAFFNAIIDYSTGNYDTYVIEDLFQRNLRGWLDDKAFRNAVYRGENSSSDTRGIRNDMGSIVARIGLLANETVTNKERLILISMLSNHWKFNLYSDSTHEIFKKTNELGRVDYYTEMPKVFKCSNINLNVSFKQIKAGIPLRCLDIMGCGGFLLSNYQKDFEEHFEDGRNVALFHSLNEAYEKCDYYLKHDEERKKIAYNGYCTVKEHYNYKVLLKKAFKISGLEHLLK